MRESPSALPIAVPTPAEAGVRKPGTFLMEIEDVFGGVGRVTATGRVIEGTVRVGDEVEIHNAGRTSSASVFEIQKFGGGGTWGELGTGEGAITFRGSSREDLELTAGALAATPGAVMSFRTFQARLHLLGADVGGHRWEEGLETVVELHFWGPAASATVTIVHVDPSSEGNVIGELALADPRAVTIGTEFVIFRDGRISGSGVISRCQL